MELYTISQFWNSNIIIKSLLMIFKKCHCWSCSVFCEKSDVILGCFIHIASFVFPAVFEIVLSLLHGRLTMRCPDLGVCISHAPVYHCHLAWNSYVSSLELWAYVFYYFGKLSTYLISCSLTFSGTPLPHILLQSWDSSPCFFSLCVKFREDLMASANVWFRALLLDGAFRTKPWVGSPLSVTTAGLQGVELQAAADSAGQGDSDREMHGHGLNPRNGRLLSHTREGKVGKAKPFVGTGKSR